MAQHDFIIDDAIGAVVRADINAAFAAIFSSSSGLTPPATTYAGQLWFDMNTSILSMRNAGNTAWETITFSFDGSISYTRSQYDALFALQTNTWLMSESDARYEAASNTYSNAQIAAKLNPILDATFAPASAPTKKAHIDASALPAGADQIIRVPNINTTLGAWELILDREILTTAPITGFLNVLNLAAFDALQMVIEFLPISAATTLGIQVSPDNGASWSNATNYWSNYLYTSHTAPTNIRGGTGSADRMQLTTGNNIPAFATRTEGAAIELTMFNLNKPSATNARGIAAWVNTTPEFLVLEHEWGNNQAVAYNALRLVTQAGTETWAGHVTIHGTRG